MGGGHLNPDRRNRRASPWAFCSSSSSFLVCFSVSFSASVSLTRRSACINAAVLSNYPIFDLPLFRARCFHRVSPISPLLFLPSLSIFLFFSRLFAPRVAFRPLLIIYSLNVHLKRRATATLFHAFSCFFSPCKMAISNSFP